jgi:hypothetical protein
MFGLIVAAGLVAAATPTPPPVPRPPALSIVFHLAPPDSDDASLAAADVALRAPEEVGELLQAVRGRPGVHLSIAVTPSYLDALDRAAHGETALAAFARGAGIGHGAGATEALEILERHRPLDLATLKTAYGARYDALAATARGELEGDSASPPAAADVADFAGDDARVVLAASGLGPQPPASSSDAAGVTALAIADGAVEQGLRAAIRTGAVELIAIPDDEPVLPLLIDAGGKTIPDPRVIAVGARADAVWLSDDAQRRVRAFGSAPNGVGFYSPYGAYDDATAAAIKGSGATFALFSDRILHGEGGQGTEAGLNAEAAASLEAYALTIDRGVTLSTLFWNESSSARLGATSGSTAAMGQRLAGIVADAAALAMDESPHILVLRLDGEGPWSQRPDARAVIDRLAATIASGHAGRSTTIGSFLRQQAPVTTAYGYSPASESGSFSLWLGSQNQSSLWRALGAARKAAGGDAVLSRPQSRALLFEAEAGRWFSLTSLPLPPQVIEQRLDVFRSLLTGLYRGAGATPPTNLAPVNLASPSPSPAPHPMGSATPTPPTAAPTPAPSPAPAASPSSSP